MNLLFSDISMCTSFYFESIHSLYSCHMYEYGRNDFWEGGTPRACRGSHARGLIGAVAASLRHSNTRSEFICDLHHSSQQHWFLNPLIEARDGTCNLMVPSQIHFRCTAAGTPEMTVFECWLFSSFVPHASVPKSRIRRSFCLNSRA